MKRYNQTINVIEKIPINWQSSHNEETPLTYKNIGLYFKFLLLLKQAQEEIPVMSRKNYLPFSNIYQKVCRRFSIDKKECRKILHILNKHRFLEFTFKGIRLKCNLEEKNV